MGTTTTIADPPSEAVEANRSPWVRVTCRATDTHSTWCTGEACDRNSELPLCERHTAMVLRSLIDGGVLAGCEVDRLAAFFGEVYAADAAEVVR